MTIQSYSRVKNGDSVTNLRLTKFDDFLLYFRIFAKMSSHAAPENPGNFAIAKIKNVHIEKNPD